MSGMIWIALELSIPKIRKIMLSLTVKKLDAFKFDGVAGSVNTAYKSTSGVFGLAYSTPQIEQVQLSTFRRRAEQDKVKTDALRMFHRLT